MLVEIKAEEYGVEIDLAYATPDNFTGKPIYRRSACFLLPEAAEALQMQAGEVQHATLRILDQLRSQAPTGAG